MRVTKKRFLVTLFCFYVKGRGRSVRQLCGGGTPFRKSSTCCTPDPSISFPLLSPLRGSGPPPELSHKPTLLSLRTPPYGVNVPLR